MRAFGSLVPCSRLSLQCSEGGLAPPCCGKSARYGMDTQEIQVTCIAINFNDQEKWQQHSNNSETFVPRHMWGKRSLDGYDNVGYPLDTTESFSLLVPSGLFCQWKQWKTTYAHWEFRNDFRTINKHFKAAWLDSTGLQEEESLLSRRVSLVWVADETVSDREHLFQ